MSAQALFITLLCPCGMTIKTSPSQWTNARASCGHCGKLFMVTARIEIHEGDPYR